MDADGMARYLVPMRSEKVCGFWYFGIGGRRSECLAVVCRVVIPFRN